MFKQLLLGMTLLGVHNYSLAGNVMSFYNRLTSATPNQVVIKAVESAFNVTFLTHNDEAGIMVFKRNTAPTDPAEYCLLKAKKVTPKSVAAEMEVGIDFDVRPTISQDPKYVVSCSKVGP